MPYTALFKERWMNNTAQCDFLIQGHQGKYSYDFPDNIILGRPFFETFYVAFNYSEGQMMMHVGAERNNMMRLEA